MCTKMQFYNKRREFAFCIIIRCNQNVSIRSTISLSALLLKINKIPYLSVLRRKYIKIQFHRKWYESTYANTVYYIIWFVFSLYFHNEWLWNIFFFFEVLLECLEIVYSTRDIKRELLHWNSNNIRVHFFFWMKNKSPVVLKTGQWPTVSIGFVPLIELINTLYLLQIKILLANYVDQSSNSIRTLYSQSGYDLIP